MRTNGMDKKNHCGSQSRELYVNAEQKECKPGVTILRVTIAPKKVDYSYARWLLPCMTRTEHNESGFGPNFISSYIWSNVIPPQEGTVIPGTYEAKLERCHHTRRFLGTQTALPHHRRIWPPWCSSWPKTRMIEQPNFRPSVRSSSRASRHGGGRSTEGANNIWVRTGCLWNWNLASFNMRTLSSEGSLAALREEPSNKVARSSERKVAGNYRR